MRWVGAVLAVAALAVGAGPAAGSDDCAPAATPGRAGGAIVKVVVAANVWSRPGGGDLRWRADTTTPWAGDPTWLLATACTVDASGRRWLRVVLPVRPNGATGWVRADFVLVRRSAYEVEISTGRAEVTVYRDGRSIRRVRAVVGATGTPTPHGLFAVYDAVSQRQPEGFVGPWVIHLTAHSTVLENFGGGPGRVAIHGRGGASMRVPLGSAASHGCIRVDNGFVSWLARTIPPGTPVRITM